MPKQKIYARVHIINGDGEIVQTRQLQVSAATPITQGLSATVTGYQARAKIGYVWRPIFKDELGDTWRMFE